MNLAFNYNSLIIFPVFLPFLFALYLIIKRLKLSYVKKSVLNSSLCIINGICFFCFLAYKFFFNAFEISFNVFSFDKILLKMGIMVDKININFLIYLALAYFIVSFFAKEYFKKKKQFIFTKQRFNIFLSLLIFNTYLFILSPNLFQNFIFWALIGLTIYIFSYFDIFKFPTSANINRFYRILLIGDFAYLTFILILFKYAVLSNGFINSISLDYSNLDILLSYSFGASHPFEYVLALFCIVAAIFSRFFIFPFNCFYSFFANSSNLLYFSVLASVGSIEGFYLFIKIIPYLEFFLQYKFYFEIFIALTILASLIFILFEKNLKIIFGHCFSITSAIFMICFLNFNHKYCAIIYYLFILMLLFIVQKLFLQDKTNLSKRIINKQKGFILERFHIFIFEKFLYKISALFNFINEKVVQIFKKIPVAVFVLFVLFFITLFFVKFSRF